MKAIQSTILTISLLTISITANAKEIKTSAAALTLCKAEAASTYAGYKSSSLKKVKQMRGKFKIYLHVKTDERKIKTICEVTRNGEITYSEK